jgi:anti-sigma factor (TIGR02949 family)
MTKGPCKEALARLYEYLDNELAPEEAQAFKTHFEKCGGCNELLNFCESFKDAIRHAAADQPCAPPELREKIAHLLRTHCASPVDLPYDTDSKTVGSGQ